ncbi:MAG: hypothetical protein ACKOLA_13365 [Spartobacteria bacterium]
MLNPGSEQKLKCGNSEKGALTELRPPDFLKAVISGPPVHRCPTQIFGSRGPSEMKKGGLEATDMVAISAFQDAAGNLISFVVCA